MTHHTSQAAAQGGHRSHLMGLAIAAAIAAGLGFLFKTEKGKEIREDISHRASDLAKNFNKTRERVQEEIRNAFGHLSEELEEDYLEIQGNLFAKMDEGRNKKELLQKDYEDMVDEVVKKFAKGRKWTEDSVNSLTKTLKSDWKEISSNF